MESRAAARVAIWARNTDKTTAAVDELSRLSEAVGIDCDVFREDDVARCLTQTVERLGPIHAGFANAGFATTHDALTMTLAEWREVTSVNLDGAFVTVRTAVQKGTADNGNPVNSAGAKTSLKRPIC